MLFIGLLEVVIFALFVVIVKKSVEGRNCKEELIAESVLLFIFFILYLLYLIKNSRFKE